MALLSAVDLSLNLAGKPLFEHAELHLEAGERVCLVGRNGAGKSSFMALLAGDMLPDSGTVTRAPGVRLGHMPQAVPDHWTGSVFAVAAAGMGPEGIALAAARLLAEGRESEVLPAHAEAARRLMETGDGWERQGEVLAVLNHLRLDPEAAFASLSGGSRRRVALARALLVSDCLLLDEPTNHLDISTIAWLEEFLVRRSRLLVFVSHDRVFARRLATRVAELDRGRLYVYGCGYDAFLERREARLEAEQRQAAVFDRKLTQEEAWIRQGIKARRTRNMGRVRALEAMRAERRARRERLGTAAMRVREAEQSGKLVIEARGARFVYPDGFEVFHDVSTVIQRGDRVGIIGDNGMGKTTLLRMLLGELTPVEGSVRHGTRLEIAYFDQLRATLDPDASVMDSIADGNDTIVIDGRQRHVAGYLLDFLFDSDRLRAPVRTLSGGEKNRLLLARLFARPSNVLVLDEPTNDLDVETLDLLEDLLSGYTGTVLMVSHDRAFLDNLATMTLALEGDKRVHEYVGGYADWLRQRPAPQEEQRKDAPARTAGGRISRRRSFREQRELDALQAELRALPERLAELEKEQAALEARLAAPDFFSADPVAFRKATERLPAIDMEQTALLERWEAVESRIAELECAHP